MMSEQSQEDDGTAPEGLSIEELAALFPSAVVGDAKDLAADVFESDEELEAFLADLRASRRASLG